MMQIQFSEFLGGRWGQLQGSVTFRADFPRRFGLSERPHVHLYTRQLRPVTHFPSLGNE